MLNSMVLEAVGWMLWGGGVTMLFAAMLFFFQNAADGRVHPYALFAIGLAVLGVGAIIGGCLRRMLR